MTYIIKPTSIRKNDIEKNEYSFFSTQHRLFYLKNKNTQLLSDLLEFENVGEQIDVKEYLSFDSKNYLGTISGMNGLLYNPKKGENISSEIYKKSNKKLKKGDVIFSRNASLGKISIVNLDYNAILNGGLSYLRFQEEYKFYSIGFFISEYGKEFLINLTSGGGTQQNAKRQNILDIKIPFPTVKNNKNPENVEKMVSFLVQNLVHKEEQIQIKNQQIDDQIEKEIKANQKEKTFIYKLPRISEIKKETRLDSGLYEKEFQEINFLIKNYKEGVFTINEKNIKGGNTPKERFFGKGDLWLTPTDINLGKFSNKSFIKTEKYNLSQDSLVIVNRSNVAETVLFEKEIFGKGQHNQGMYRVKIEKEKHFEYIFILSWFNSAVFQKYINQVATGATFKEIRVDDISKRSLIPSFPDLKQKEIAKLYYNKIEKNSDLTLENYLENEKSRNEKIGIFQLNMESFDLRKTLEELVYKIAMEEKIDIKF